MLGLIILRLRGPAKRLLGRSGIVEHSSNFLPAVRRYPNRNPATDASFKGTINPVALRPGVATTARPRASISITTAQLLTPTGEAALDGSRDEGDFTLELAWLMVEGLSWRPDVR